MEIHKNDYETDVRLKGLEVAVGLVEEKSEEDKKIELLIRTRYSMSMETALHRKKLMGILPDSEWNEYCTFVQECIDEARSAESV